MKSDEFTDDQRLLDRFLEGDKAAFTELVERYQRPLYSFIWRYVRNHEDTADLCQRVFMQVFLKVAGFRGEARFKTWLYQVAINQCRNHFRSRKNERQMNADVDALPDEPADDNTADLAHDAQHVQAAVAALPPKQRRTIELRFYQGCTFAEIAEIMGCPIGTAKANYHHAMTALRKDKRGLRS